MDYRTVLYGPVYAVEGVTARLVLPTGQVFDDLTAIDKTAGVQLAGGIIDVETVRPVAAMMVGDLNDAGIPVDDLDESTLTLNGVAWKVIGHRMMPSPSGPNDGEVYLLLEGTAGG